MDLTNMNFFRLDFLNGPGVWLVALLPVLFFILIAWSLLWKGLALWHAARRNEGWWFVVLLLLNTGGILELVYLFLVAKIPKTELFGPKKN
jgi:hypothetical protein